MSVARIRVCLHTCTYWHLILDNRYFSTYRYIGAFALFLWEWVNMLRCDNMCELLSNLDEKTNILVCTGYLTLHKCISWNVFTNGFTEDLLSYLWYQTKVPEVEIYWDLPIIIKAPSTIGDSMLTDTFQCLSAFLCLDITHSKYKHALTHTQ